MGDYDNYLGYAECILFFPPYKLLNGEIIKGTSIKQFIDEIYLKYGVKLAGVEPSTDGFGFRVLVGGEPLS